MKVHHIACLGALAVACMAEGDEALANLTRWIVEEGGSVSSNVRVSAWDSANGRGIFAAKALQPGAEIARIPWDCTLRGTAAEMKGQIAPDEEALAPPAEVSVFLKLLRESRGESKLEPYLKVLPLLEDFTTAMYVSDANAKCLSANLRAQREFLFQKADRYTAAAAEEGELPETTTLWAFNTVATRALNVNGDCLLVPLFDFLNHAREGNVDIDPQEDALVIRVKSGLQGNVATGTQLTVNYGSHLSATKLFTLYGFVDTTFDEVPSQLAIPVPQSALEAVRAKSIGLDVLLAMNCNNASATMVPLHGKLPPKVLECVTLTIVDAKTRIGYPMLSDSEKASLIEAHYYDTLQVFGTHLIRVIAEYPSPDDSKCPVPDAADTKEAEMHALIGRLNLKLRKAYMGIKDALDNEVEQSGAPKVYVSKNSASKQQEPVEEQDDDYGEEGEL
ncbi:hypothetical protein DIPPA_27452 [Diplonema papillatum]|nr:hypothetical protein DIPPA_27452 [Diplonema papillatum]